MDHTGISNDHFEKNFKNIKIFRSNQNFILMSNYSFLSVKKGNTTHQLGFTFDGTRLISLKKIH